MSWQVYTATHDGKGEPLSVMDRHFISFSYGGKNIEDFNLLSVTTGNRLSKNFSASFQNTTSQYVGLDGQHFWLSTYDPLRLTFNLATDGISEKEIEDFKRHFKPGIEQELILSEHPNRYIMARVENAPSYSFLPFEKKVQVKNIDVRTTEYKGEATITFVADEPFWYSKENVIEKSALTASTVTEEQLKIYVEDGVPFTAFFQTGTNIILGDNVAWINNRLENFKNISLIINDTPTYYLYNPSSAVVKPEISFTFEPEKSGNYISYPANTYNISDLSSFEYSYLKIGDNKFEYTTPSVLTAINEAIKIANNFNNSGQTSVIDLIYKMREGIHHYVIRAKVVGILTGWNTAGSKYVNLESGAFNNSSWCADLVTLILNKVPLSMSASFNSKTGDASVKYTLDNVSYEEKAGDMVKSNYLMLEEGSFKTDGTKIKTDECLPIVSSNSISNFKINYKYAYL